MGVQQPPMNQMLIQQQRQRMPEGFRPQQQSFMPDIAIKDPTTAMFDALLSDDNVPKEVVDEFWFVFHRDNTLGFQDPERKTQKMLSFDILKIDKLNNTPWYQYTFQNEMKWNAARQMLDTKLDRAVGNGKGVNERLAIPMMIQENRSITEDRSNTQRAGFLSRLLNRR